MIKKRILPLTTLIFLWIPIAAAQEYMMIPRIKGDVILDGLSTEPAWENIEPLPLIMHEPNFGSEPSEQTEIRIAYNEEYLYASARFYDPEPDLIQAPSKKRDELNLNNEWFGIVLDTFNDNENALAFFTTPAGLRLDMTVFDDAQGDFPINPSWNTFWEVKTVVNDQGWFAEMRIPFSSLRFQDDDGKVTMGLITWRWQARKNELDIFPAINPEWGFWSVFKASKAAEVVFEGIQSRNPLFIAPYALGGYGKSNDLNEDEDDYIEDEDFEHEVGLDIKYGLTTNLTLDVTLNTDFAQVEADDQQINLTRFSLFFPEKRIFFQERSSNFEFNMGGPNRLFYSRQIGIYDDRPVRIYGGARLVGRAGDYDLGILNMQTGPAEDFGSENFSVVRIRRQVINPNTYVGGIITSRLETGGGYNTAYGLDGLFRLFGDDYLVMNWAQTFQDGYENDPGTLDAAKIRVNWERRTIKGIGYHFDYSRAGEDYDPGMGFEMREDYTRFGYSVWHGWVPEGESILQNYDIFVDGEYVTRNSDRSVESTYIEPGLGFASTSGYYGEINMTQFYESLDEEFELTDEGDIVVPVGDYNFSGVEVIFGLPESTPAHVEIGSFYGSFFDGTRFRIGSDFRWSASNSLELSGSYLYNWVDFPDRDQRLEGHIARLRALYMPTIKFSASAFIQYNGIDDLFIGNVRLRYNPSEGRDLYLVYDEGIFTERENHFPIRPYTSNRTILLKYTHTLRYVR